METIQPPDLAKDRRGSASELFPKEERQHQHTYSSLSILPWIQSTRRVASNSGWLRFASTSRSRRWPLEQWPSEQWPLEQLPSEQWPLEQWPLEQ